MNGEHGECCDDSWSEEDACGEGQWSGTQSSFATRGVPRVGVLTWEDGRIIATSWMLVE